MKTEHHKVSNIKQWKVLISNFAGSFSERIYKLNLSVICTVATTLLIVMSLMNPFIYSKDSEISVILDNSKSMLREYGNGRETNFSLAKQYVNSLVQRYGRVLLCYKYKEEYKYELVTSDKQVNSIEIVNSEFDIDVAYKLLDKFDQVIFVTDSYYNASLPSNLVVYQVEQGSPFNVGIAAYEARANRVMINLYSNKNGQIAIDGEVKAIKKGYNVIFDKTVGITDDLSMDNLIGLKSERFKIKFEGDQTGELFKFVKLLNNVDLVFDNEDVTVINRADGIVPAQNGKFFINNSVVSGSFLREQLIADSVVFAGSDIYGFEGVLSGPIVVRPVEYSDKYIATPIARYRESDLLVNLSRENSTIVLSGVDFDIELKQKKILAVPLYEIFNMLLGFDTLNSSYSEDEIDLKPAINKPVRNDGDIFPDRKKEVSNYFIGSAILLSILSIILKLL